MKKRFVLLVVALALVVCAVGGTSIALAARQSPQRAHMPMLAVSTTIYACSITPGDYIDISGAAGTIPSSISANVACPTGESKIMIGAPSISGYVVVHSAYLTINPGVIGSVACPVGAAVLGGGVELGHLNAQHVFVPDAFGAWITSNHQGYDSHGNPTNSWWGSYGGTTTTVRIWAECAKIAP